MFQDRKCCETTFNHTPVAFQCVYGYSNEKDEIRDEDDGKEISVEEERVDITWPLVCR